MKKLSDLTILYIEDDAQSRELLTELIGDQFKRFLTASDGVAGLSILTYQKIDLVICDIEMPNLNGLAVARKIKKLYPSIPIIMLTAYERVVDFKESIDIGVDAYFTKPIEDPEKLLTKLYSTYSKYSIIQEEHTFSKNLEELYDALRKQYDDERKIKQSFENNQEQLTQILNASLSAVRIARLEDHQILYANSEYNRLVSRDANLNLPVTEYYTNPEDYKAIITHLQAGETVHHQKMQYNIQGKDIWAFASYSLVTYHGDKAVLAWFHDITDLVNFQNKVIEQRDELESIYNTSVDGLAILDQQGNILNHNKAFSQILGLTGKPMFMGSLCDYCLNRKNPSELDKLLKSKALYAHCEAKLQISKNEQIILAISFAQMPDKTRTLLNAKDITHLKKKEQALIHLSTHDPLTGLANRILLMDKLEILMPKSLDEHKIMALINIDLDGFKDINDRYGHSAGDSLLKELSQTMRASLKDEHTLARIGGDEFVVLLYPILQKKEVMDIAEELLTLANTVVLHQQHQLQVSASIGVCFFSQHINATDTAEEILHKADKAMYQAKYSGKNKIVEYVDE